MSKKKHSICAVCHEMLPAGELLTCNACGNLVCENDATPMYSGDVPEPDSQAEPAGWLCRQCVERVDRMF